MAMVPRRAASCKLILVLLSFLQAVSALGQGAQLGVALEDTFFKGHPGCRHYNVIYAVPVHLVQRGIY